MFYGAYFLKNVYLRNRLAQSIHPLAPAPNGSKGITLQISQVAAEVNHLSHHRCLNPGIATPAPQHRHPI